MVRIDLHAHSAVSDGTDAPAALVRAAARAGLDVLALTDHDTTDGWSEAQAAGAEVGVRVVPGIEISTRADGHSVHLLAYYPDPTAEELCDELRRVLDGRWQRVPAMVARLRAAGIAIDVDAVLRHAANPEVVGRPHVADALVAAGAAQDRSEAFRRWLAPGRPGHLERYAADLTTMIGVVSRAGGVAVLAHPWGRTQAPYLTAERIAALAAAGLAGIEVDHEDHDPAARRALRGIAVELDLVVTGSSDHHGTGKTGHALGCNMTDPEEFARLMDRAATARLGSGRELPEEWSWTR